jgi:hypothetical protein
MRTRGAFFLGRPVVRTMIRSAIRRTGCAWLVVLGLMLAACSRSGSVYGDLVLPPSHQEGTAIARVGVTAVPATEAFERDWAAAVTAFQDEILPARVAAATATAARERARWTWDRALAVPRNARIRGRERALHAAERRLTKATEAVREVARRHAQEAVGLLEKHAILHVQTDEAGHYVLAGLPTGRVYVYVEVSGKVRSLVWFRPVQVQARAQRLDLTGANSGGWPFEP